MPEELSEISAESALEGAFGTPEPAEPVKAEVPAEIPLLEPEGEAVEAETPEVVADVAEPEFEIEYNGAPEVVKGADRIKELLQKGLGYGRGSEENARIRENLVAQVQFQQQNLQIAQAVIGDIAELKALDQQLEEWAKVDFGAIFDSDPFKAMKLKEQRDALREQRTAKFNQLNQKQAEAQRANSQAQQNLLHAEGAALLAKLPEWRNSEKAQTERTQITSYLQSQGFANGEVEALTDHRALLIARKAWLYDQLQKGKQTKVNQVRTAPPVVKPGVTQSQTNGKVEFQKARAKLKEFGSKGQTRAQEQLATRMFERAFKP